MRVSRLWRFFGWTLLVLVALTAIPVLCLRWIPPPTSAFMLGKRVTSVLQGRPQPLIHFRWVGWESISPQMRIAVVAAEDQKFPSHWGFDFESIADAVQEKSARRRLRGASTLTQQVARNLFLWPGRSYVRKGLEAYFTVLLELLWPKRRILEVYLNSAEFGRGIWGVEAASRRYFGKPAARLNRPEAALLAAVLPSPKRFRVANPSPYVRQRQDWVLWQMRMLEPELSLPP